jgi:uncharacterized protein (DUF302 family)
MKVILSHQFSSSTDIEVISAEVPSFCEEYKFALLQTYVYHEIVESKGFPIQRKVFIFEICQARVASLILTSYPQFSVFMPCKIVLYEELDQTVITTMDLTPMLQVIGQDEPIFQEANTLYEQLKSLLLKLAGI